LALPPAATFLVWGLVRARSGAPSLRLAASIAAAGSIPIVLHAAHDNPELPLFFAFAYVLVHGAGLAYVGASERSGAFIAGGQALWVSALLGLIMLTRTTDATPFALVLFPVGLAFWALPFVSERLRVDRLAWLSAALALPLHFALLYAVARGTWRAEWLGLCSVLCAALSLVSLREARRRAPRERQDRLFYDAVFGGETLLFVTAAVPILLSKEWITVAWSLEVAALSWLRRRVPHRGLFYAMALLGAGVSVRLLTNSALWDYYPRSGTPILNFYSYTFGVPALAFFAAARWLERDAEQAPWRLPMLLQILATLFLFVLLNVEVADYFSTGSTLTFHLSGGSLAEDMTYSLVWGGFALALLMFGIVARRKAPRIGALLVLTLTIGKVFLHDLWELGSLYRVVSIVGLALALLGVSFLTQRFILKKEAV
jgi:uncharacterized membrane protein